MADRYSERGGHWDDEERRAHYEARGREREYRRDDRGFLDRAGDELRSWFGDEEAQRRRMMDEREDWRGERGRGGEWGRGDWARGDWSARESRGDWSRPRGDWSREPEPRDWSRQWGYVEGGGPRRDYGGSFSGSGPWGRERDMGRGGWPRGESWRGETSRGDWGGQGPSGSGVSRNREDWSQGRTDPDWGRYAGLAQSREVTQGPHSGRGPRNYQRSDERIREDICERLCEHGQLDASDVDVRVQNGEVTMQGSVPDRWAKRTAEDLAENVFGVKEVHNQLRVSVSNAGREGEEIREQPNRATQQRGPWAA